jgi:hypothetical protein
MKEIINLLKTDLGNFNEDDQQYTRHKPTRADDGSTDPYLINFEPQTVADGMEFATKLKMI